MRGLTAAIAVAVASNAVPGMAQQAPAQLEKRVGKLESEMRAVQRKVFPGGDKRFFEPEFPATDPAAAPPAGVPATSPIADLTTRVDSLERQLQTLTGQVEQANFKVRQMEEAMAKFRADAEFRLTQLEGGAKPGADTGAATTAPTATPTTPVETAAVKPAPAKPVAKPAVAPADPADRAETAAPAATAEAKPADPVEAAYQAAYAHVSAKRNTEAEKALQDFVAKHPKSSRASHAQYWLGRTYMTQKKPAQAAKAYLDNYRNLPKGARAADSLLGLGGALMALSPPQPEKACDVYTELEAAYGAKLSADQKSQLTRARTSAKCG